jgi:hypothetical protein
MVPAAALLVAAGCSDKNSGPAGPSDLELDAESVQQQSVSTLTFVHDLIGGVDELAAGDFSGVGGDLGLPSTLRAEPTPVWDGTAWVLDFEGTETDASGTATYDVYFRVQYLDGVGTPQQTPDQTTSALSLVLDYVVDGHSEDQGSTFDLLVDYALDLQVGNLQGGPYLVDGSGDMFVDLQFSGDGESLRLAMGMGWAADLTVPTNGGCPSGTASVSVENWTFNATYAGQPTYDWELLEGASPVAQGTEALFCTVPAS